MLSGLHQWIFLVDSLSRLPLTILSGYTLAFSFWGLTLGGWGMAEPFTPEAPGSIPGTTQQDGDWDRESPS